MLESVKILSRLCKEEGYYGKWFKMTAAYIEKKINETKSFDYVFFPLCGEVPIYLQYKIQLHFLKKLLDLNYFDANMMSHLIGDILNRYDTSDKKKFNDDNYLYKEWKTIEKLSNKHEIRDYFIKKFNQLPHFPG